jgi:hypothetical protein
MGVWTELVGVRRDLRLRAKWWHHAAVGLAWFTGLLAYLIVAGAVARRPQKLTTANTYSLTLLNDATARKTTTTLADLDALSGIVGSVGSDGELVPLPRTPGADIRCENKAGYKGDETVTIGERSYNAIPDYPGQPAGEPRHCIAAGAYSTFTADAVAVYVPDGTGLRKQQVRAFVAGMMAVVIWLVVYWNLYYRGIMPFYARARQERRRRHLERQTIR